jgi:hypothetical protein
VQTVQIRIGDFVSLGNLAAMLGRVRFAFLNLLGNGCVSALVLFIEFDVTSKAGFRSSSDGR